MFFLPGICLTSPRFFSKIYVIAVNIPKDAHESMEAPYV